MTKPVEISRTVIKMALFVITAQKILRLLRLIVSILISRYILMF
jgi:hypothetical protein